MLKTKDERSIPKAAVQRTSDKYGRKYLFYTPLQGKVGVLKSIQSDFKAGPFEPGLLRLNPVTIKTSKVVSTVGRLSGSQLATFFHEWEGNLFMNALPWDENTIWPVYPEALSQWSHTGALSKLNEAKFDVLVFMAELRESLVMLRHPLSSLQRFLADKNTRLLLKDLERLKPTISNLKTISKLKRKVNADLLVPMDTISGIWLQLRYGLMPLLYDLEGIIGIIEDKIDDDPKVLRAKRSSKKSFESGTNYGNLVFSNLIIPYAMKYIYTFKSSSVVYYNLATMSRSAHVIRDLNLRVEHIPVVLWELTRLSFVADWFLNVGDFLQSIEPNTAVSILGGCTSEKTTVSRIVSVCGTPRVPGEATPMKIHIAPSAIYSAQRLVRKTPIALPASPVFNVSTLSVKRAADAIALLWSATGNRIGRIARKF